MAGLFDFLRQSPLYVDNRKIAQRGKKVQPLESIQYVLGHDSGTARNGKVSKAQNVHAYHIVVGPDGKIYENYGPDQRAPHAFRANDRSLGVAYAGKSGQRPTAEARKSLQFVYNGLKKALPKVPWLGHGEAFRKFQKAEFAVRPSRQGRPVQEASGWLNDLRKANQKAGVPDVPPLPVKATRAFDEAKPPRYVQPPEQEPFSIVPPEPRLEREGRVARDTAPRGPVAGRVPTGGPQEELGAQRQSRVGSFAEPRISPVGSPEAVPPPIMSVGPGSPLDRGAPGAPQAPISPILSSPDESPVGPAGRVGPTINPVGPTDQTSFRPGEQPANLAGYPQWALDAFNRTDTVIDPVGRAYEAGLSGGTPPGQIPTFDEFNKTLGSIFNFGGGGGGFGGIFGGLFK